MKTVFGVSALVVVAGIAGTVIYGVSNASADLTTINVKVQETSFGDLAADALCDAADTTISLIGAKNFKPGTIQGEVTQAKVRSLLSVPDETWVVSRLTGIQIKDALERSLGMLPRENIAFLQVSGLTVLYNPGVPRNRRVISIKTADGPLEEQESYDVAMPLSLAKGGSGYFKIFNEKHIKRRSSQGLAAAIMAFVNAQEELEYTGQGRISPNKG